MDRHSKRHTSLGPNFPSKVARREPNLINPPTNDHFPVDRNSQRGFGMTPTDLPDEIRQFFQEERPWGTNQNLRHVYVRNFHCIHDTKTINRRSKIFLRYLNHSHSPLIETIVHVLEDIFSR